MKERIHTSSGSVVLIVGDFTYPFGSAAAAHVRCLAQALAAQGVKPKVIAFNRLDARPEDGPPGQKGYNGIAYDSVLGFGEAPKRSTTPLGKVRWFLGHCAAAIPAYKYIANSLTVGSVEAIIIYGRNAIQIEPVIRLAKRKGVTVLSDVVEWPDAPGRKLNPLDWVTRRALCTSNSLVDGIIAISENIRQKYASRGMPTLLLPALVEPDRYHRLGLFPERSSPDNAVFTCCYVGNLSPKDDPDTMIEAIRRCQANGHPIELDVVGSDGRTGYAKTIREYCEANGLLAERVRFRGRVPESDLGRYVVGADAAILLRKLSPMELASFPTRLPELLMSARPVVTTRLGDIPRYLRDGLNAVMVKPGDPVELGERLEMLVTNRPLAMRIGKAGLEAGIAAFSYQERGRDLVNYIESFQVSDQS